MKRNKLFECNGSKCKLKQIPSTYTEEELSPFVKLDTSHGNGVAHIGECNAIIADPDYIDLLMGNYEFSSAVVVVLSLIQGVSKWTTKSKFKRDEVPQAAFGLHAGSSLKKVIWYQNKTFKTNGGPMGIFDSYIIYGEKIYAIQCFGFVY